MNNYSDADKSKADYREYNLDKKNNQQKDSIKVLWDYLKEIIRKYHLSKTDDELEGIKYNLSDDDENSEIVVQVPEGKGIISGELVVNKQNKLVWEFFNDENYPQMYYEYWLSFTDKNGKKYNWKNRTESVPKFIEKLSKKYKDKFLYGGSIDKDNYTIGGL